MSKIGVFVCHCGENISATVDCAKVAETAGKYDGVTFSVDYKYMCSDPGQTINKERYQGKGTDRSGRSILLPENARTYLQKSLR